MSSATGDDAARAEHLQQRLRGSLRRVVFLVVPSAVAFVAIGGSIVALLFQTGRFGADDTDGRVDHPRRLGARPVGGHAGPPARLGVLRARRSEAAAARGAGPGRRSPACSAGRSRCRCASGSATARRGARSASPRAPGFAAWIEFLLLRRWLARRIGPVPIPVRLGLGALARRARRRWRSATPPGSSRPRPARQVWLSAIAAIGVFGVVYLGIMIAAKVPEAAAFTRRLRRRR